MVSLEKTRGGEGGQLMSKPKVKNFCLAEVWPEEGGHIDGLTQMEESMRMGGGSGRLREKGGEF